jgi:hypothetical protein
LRPISSACFAPQHKRFVLVAPRTSKIADNLSHDNYARAGMKIETNFEDRPDSAEMYSDAMVKMRLAINSLLKINDLIHFDIVFVSASNNTELHLIDVAFFHSECLCKSQVAL